MGLRPLTPETPRRHRTLEDLRALAAEHGGRCLARSVADAAHDACVEWECKRGHRFAIRLRCVRRGQWCAICRSHDETWQQIFARAQALAAEHGGRCLSRTRVEGSSDAILEWECAEGHRFMVRRRCVKAGQWCPTCRKADGAWSRALARAAELGGACLDRGEHSSIERVRWRCAEGHVWTSPAHIIASGSWCRRCSGRRLGIEHMRAMAAERGGRCISRTFVDANTKLHWECEHGHRWWAVPLNVRHRDSWCPECRPEPKIKDSWNVALARAKQLGGACLAPPGPEPGARARWRCAAGHEWTSAPYKVAAGAWCSHCSGRRLTIEHMHAMAAERDGRCVSKEYLGCHTKLQWECEKGHRWWARPTILRQTGCWCPQCAWDRNAERMRSDARDRR